MTTRRKGDHNSVKAARRETSSIAIIISSVAVILVLLVNVVARELKEGYLHKTESMQGGWAEIVVKLVHLHDDQKRDELTVPFLVTNERLDCPILVYNVIEELVKQDGNSVEAVYTSFPGKGRNKLNALVNFIQSLTVGSKLEKKDMSDHPKEKNSLCSLSCKHRFSGKYCTPVLFEPDELNHWPQDVEINETLTNIKKKLCQRSKILLEILLIMISSKVI